MTRGWQPSFRYRSACFMSSPINNTVDVVPSLSNTLAVKTLLLHGFESEEEDPCHKALNQA